MTLNTNVKYAKMLWENLKRLLNTLVYVLAGIQILMWKITITLAFIREKELRNLSRRRFGREDMFNKVEERLEEYEFLLNFLII
jgi:hypothetical protein